MNKFYCPECGEEITLQNSYLDIRGRFCSKTCAIEHERKFWESIDLGSDFEDFLMATDNEYLD